MSAKREGRLRRRHRMLWAVALSVLSVGLRASAEDAAPKTQAPPSNAASRTSLHQELRFKASPQRLYEILLSSQLFTLVTGAPATIDANVGGAFSLFGGMIVGRNIELVPNQRLVQAWRPANWPPGVYSLVHFELKPEGTETLLVLNHTGFPAGGFDHLSAGWTEHYWQPLTKYLAPAAAGATPTR
jgi:activator of HSP90 ATPase